MQVLPSNQTTSHEEYAGFSLGSVNRTSDSGNNNNSEDASKSFGNCDEQEDDNKRLESKSKRDDHLIRNKSKEKRNRRKERKRDIVRTKSLKIVGVNCAGLLSKLESFEKLLVDEEPSIFSLQETKLSKPNQIKTESSRNYTIYELFRKKSGGGGLSLGIHKDLQPVWINQGDDEVECLAVEVWVNEFPIRIVNGYGP